LGWVGWHTDWGQVAQAFARLRIGPWLAAVGVLVLAQVVSARRWQLVAEALGFHRPLRQLTGFYFIGMYFNLVLPPSVGGDVVRAWYLDGGSGRRLGAFLTVLLDRLSGLVVLLAVACVAVALCPLRLPAWVGWSVWGAAGGGLLALGALPLVTSRLSGGGGGRGGPGAVGPGPAARRPRGGAGPRPRPRGAPPVARGPGGGRPAGVGGPPG